MSREGNRDQKLTFKLPLKNTENHVKEKNLHSFKTTLLDWEALNAFPYFLCYNENQFPQQEVACSLWASALSTRWY